MAKRIRVCLLTTLALSVVTSGCGGGDSERATATPPTKTGSGSADTPTSGSRFGKAATYSQDAELSGGDKIALLPIPQIGKLLVRCGQSHGASTAFRADNLLPTADVVVTTSGSPTTDTTLQPNRTFAPTGLRGLPYSQTWNIAPYAEAQVRVTTIFVALRMPAPGTIFRCAASAQAIVGAPTGSASG